MAEARLGVEPIVVEGEFLDINTRVPKIQVSFDPKGTVIFIPSVGGLARSAWRWCRSTVTKVSIAFAPLPLPAVIAAVGAFVGGTLASKQSHWWKWMGMRDFLWRLDEKMPFQFTKTWSTNWKIVNLAVLTSSVSLYCYAAGQRFILRRLLEYHGWMGDRKGTRVATKVWFFLLNYCFIHRIHESTQAYQPCLPSLPLQSLQSTTAKYMRSVEPLLSDTELEAHRAELKEFLANEGPQLQRLCTLKWLTSSNYVSDWWLMAIYLRSRDSIMINSNWFGMTFEKWTPTNDQAARAAGVCYIMANVHRDIANETFEPQLVRGFVPLCMDQYHNVFGTTRIPHATCDQLIKYEYSECSRHAVAIHKGQMFRVPLYSPETRRQYTPLQMYDAFKTIIENDKNTTKADIDSDPARLLPVLTTMNRDKWANIRETEMQQNHTNRAMLAVIESAAFVINLDDEEVEDNWTELGRQFFFGTGCNRWCDKSASWIVSKNGKTGVHGEHSWGDAPVVGHIQEIQATVELQGIIHDEDGKLKRLKADDLPSTGVCVPTRLRFEVSRRLADTVMEAKTEIRKAIADVTIPIQKFTHFGKKSMSRDLKVSPDACIQMALQLAWWRDQGCFVQTYESSMTRFFKLGRTETIRSLSKESCAFVAAFEDPNTSVEEKYRLFVAACEHHQATSQDAMTGLGVDRHLFALYVISLVRGVESPFLKNAMTARKWRLSTSQIPPRQLAEAEYAKIPKERRQYAVSSNGGFNTVATNGYGCCYMVDDNHVFFSCSSSVSCPTTDSDRMHKRIEKALLDIRSTFIETAKSSKGAAE